MEFTPRNILDVRMRQDFRDWLAAHHDTLDECWVEAKRGRPEGDGALYYIDAVEEALCFGWIDSVWKRVDGRSLQRFSPRTGRSPWSELNKERVRRLEKLGLMTDAGRAVLPPLGPRSFRIDPAIERALKDARCWKAFRALPPLYQRVRAQNLMRDHASDPEAFARALARLVDATRAGRTLGQWDDYGRLSHY